MKRALLFLVLLALGGCSRDLWKRAMVEQAIQEGVPALINWID